MYSFAELQYINMYHCLDCDIKWVNWGGCEFDDECPDCDIYIEPFGHRTYPHAGDEVMDPFHTALPAWFRSCPDGNNLKMNRKVMANVELDD